MIFNGFDTLRALRPEVELHLKRAPECRFCLVPHIEGTLSVLLVDPSTGSRVIVRDGLDFGPLEIAKVVQPRERRRRVRRGAPEADPRIDPGPPRQDDVWRDLVRGLSRL